MLLQWSAKKNAPAEEPLNITDTSNIPTMKREFDNMEVWQGIQKKSFATLTCV
jgi:hypothetical protein